jgi:hypothetical protein
LVAVPEAGGSLQTFEVESKTGHSRGAIWGSGNAPPVDSAGNIWVATGNGKSFTFDWSETVIKFSSNLQPLDWWAPSNWYTLDNSDLDLGSSMPVPLPAGLIFQIGKSGVGYLLSASHLGHVAGKPLFSQTVCPGSWGGGIYVKGVIYVTCSDGQHALSLNTTTKTFAPLAAWAVNASAVGPPTFAGGLIWSANYNGNTLYGLNPATGATVFSTNLNGFEHFMSPSAGGGRLFIANRGPSAGGDEVTAFQIASTLTPP